MTDGGERASSKAGLFARAIPLILVLAVVAALYWRILGYQFSIIDDGVNVFHNPYISNPHAQSIGALWTAGYYALYMPLTDTIWALCARIAPLSTPHIVPPGGANVSILNPAVFHAASLLLHLGTVALVYLIARRCRLAPWPSAGGALFFGLHPVQVQSVAWITGMNNLTGGFFGFLALWFYLQSAHEGDPSSRPQASVRSLGCYGLASVALIAALLCKPTATIIPVDAALFEIFLLQRPLRLWAARLGAWLLPAVACGIVNSLAAKHDNAAVWSPVWGRPFIAGDSLAFALGKLLFPFGLTFDYGRSTHVVLGHAWGYVTWVFPAFAVGAFWHYRGRFTPATQRFTALAAALFAVGLLPTVGIVPYYTEWVSSVADRYLYLPLLGPALGVAYLLARPNPVRRYSVPIFAILLLVFAFQTARILPIWKDMNSLTDAMLAATPASWMAHGNEGYIAGGRGELDLALREFTIADQLEAPHTATNRFFIGVTLTEMGRFDEAIAPLTDAFQINPGDDEFAYQLWNALAYLKRMGEAQAVLTRHLALHPADGRSELNMGKMLVAQNRASNALPYLQKAKLLLPNEPAVEFFLGAAYEQAGSFPDALVHYKRASAMDPGRDEIRAAITRLEGRK